MDINKVYNLINPTILPNLYAVDNPFIQQLAHLSTEQAKHLKTTSFVLKNIANNRGEIAQRGVHASEKSVLDITKLTPLVDRQNFRTLQEEIAYTRNWQLQMHDTLTHPTWWRENAEMLMVDYLLASCLCYIEEFDGKAASSVTKYFATRNRFLAGALAGLEPHETVKYTNNLQTVSHNYEAKQLKVLKLGVNKSSSTFRITQPRSFVDFSKQIKITPVFLMTTLMEGLQPALSRGILRFKYLKDNLTEREFITTTNTDILIRTYGEDFAQKMVFGIGTHFNRGYVKLPEYGTSRYDYSGVRALNISRITSIEQIDPSQVDLSFIDIDFDTILPSIKQGVYQITHPQVLHMVYQELSGNPASATLTVPELRVLTDQFLDTQYAIGTTTALRYMHKYMVARPKVFPTYNHKGYMGVDSSTQQPNQQTLQTQQQSTAHVHLNNQVQQGFVDPSTQQPNQQTPSANPLAQFGIDTSEKAPTPTFLTSANQGVSAQQPTQQAPSNLFGTPFNLGGASED